MAQKQKSYFFYIHREIQGIPDVWKAGKSITPYSAVRARQKFCWNTFSLDYLWFGRPKHIDILEDRVKYHFNYCSAKGDARTELFNIDIDTLLKYVSYVINEYNLDVKIVELEQPYSSANSGNCPLSIPPEGYHNATLDARLELEFGPDSSEKLFNNLFTVL